MNREFEDFLNYGITGKITKKELVQGDFLLLFCTLLTMAISQLSIIICVISAFNLILGCVLTYSKQDVIGKKIFWIHGIWATTLTFVFALIGTCAAMYVIEGKYHVRFILIVIGIYLLVILLYTGMIVHLIKKGAYSKTHKVRGRVFFMIFGVGGMALARVLIKEMDNNSALQCLSICFYLCSFLSMLGIFGFVKYYYLKKLES